MATISILLGSIIGFLGGLVAYFGLDASLLLALAIWLGAGPASVIVVILTTLARPAQTAEQPVFAEAA